MEGRNMFIMKMQGEFFDQVKSGKKIYEVRLYDEKRQKIGIGDTIIFKKQPELIDGVVTKVVDVKRFDTFEQMAQTLSLSSVGFDNKNAGQVARFYRSIYSREDEKKYGVIAFKIELL
ncbi:MAG: ASCH domain-containing protein [Clostridiales bacterium]|nr:ASCH domain-containing protein [Clostridiales bacterium]